MVAARIRKKSGEYSESLLPELRVLLVCLQALSARGMELRTTLKARVQSTGAHLLTLNDDDAERAQMRVPRATTLLRKSSGMMMAFDFEQVSTPQRESNVLSRGRILELHNNCIKLAAENVREHYVSLPLLDHC